MSRKPQFLGEMFSSLKIRNYKLYFFGQMLSVSGTWMQTIAQGLLVLKLTHNGTILGIAFAVRYLPILLFGPMGGVWTDRLNTKKLLTTTQILAGSLAVVYATLTGTGVIRIWMIYILGFSLGCVNVFDAPARNSLIPELVPREELANAVGLNSVTINAARVIGGALGGSIVALFGIAWCFGLNALSYVAVVSSLFMMQKSAMFTHEKTPREPGQLREGFRYIRNTPEIALPLIMIAVVGTMTWEFPITLPLMNEFVFHRGPASYGLMTVFMSIGAITGGFFVALRGAASMKALAFGTIFWGVVTCIAGIAPNFTLELIALIFVGVGSLVFNAQAKTALQLAAEPRMRGRVVAVWSLAWGGSTPIGGPIVGYIGQTAGARWSLIAGGVPAIVIALIVFPSFLKVDRRLKARAADAEVAVLTEEGLSGSAAS